MKKILRAFLSLGLSYKNLALQTICLQSQVFNF